MKILFTGGLGYIGSHTAVEVLNEGHDVVIIDNLSNSKIEVLDKIKTITGKDVKFYKEDVCDLVALEKVFAENPDIFAVIHFAGYKAVGESVKEPLKYYQNNLVSTFNLLEVMKKYDCKNLVFSSSATVYAPSEIMPLDETFPLQASNPYGRTKLFNEQILIDYQAVNPDFNVTLLRYFNPIGAHESGLLGEDPNGIPNNLMPYICKVAIGELDHLNVFGNDYKTKDGTGVRDYIHVVDLAIGHVKALQKMIKEGNSKLGIYNLGTGVGYSVLDIVNAFNRVNGDLVKYEIAPRRPGDIDECYASPKKAEEELGFKAVRGLDEMCKSSYQYNAKNKTK
ncbi:MAG: UDP-glucose 4-epimerase GalE [Clostridia bacterium]|nr:UDP-glucose 4-epimerase GalE [Clostridia bacterium]MBR2390966.1 UDP-glucose 4-epimerase GalE [Clostridia bacterium]